MRNILECEELNGLAKHAAEHYRNLTAATETVALATVLGTGWGKSVAIEHAVPLLDLCPQIFGSLKQIEGHARKVGIATIGEQRVFVASGRIHMYEQNPEALYVFVRILWELGARRLILTNASGGLRKSVGRGDIVVVDGITKNCPSPLDGARFTAPGDMLSPRLAREIWATCPLKRVHIGGYVASLGPEFESDEDRAFVDRPGVMCVGMSSFAETVLWTYFANTIGTDRWLGNAYVSAISCVSNGLIDAHGHESNVSALMENSKRLGQMLEHTVATVASWNTTPHQ